MVAISASLVGRRGKQAACPARPDREAVGPARIRDVSDTGCRVPILAHADDLPDRFGATGLLWIHPSERGEPGVAVPVTLRHIQVDGGALHHGPEFRPMSLRQATRLAAVVADPVAAPPPRRLIPAPAPEGRAAARA